LVRFSAGALPEEQLASISAEEVRPSTLGFWRFEAKTGTMSDSSGRGRELSLGTAKAEAAPKAEHIPMAALCHALLENSSEFLYVE
jgi:hypothetical protein